MTDEELQAAYAEAIKNQQPVPGATIPRSFASGPGQSQGAADVVDADPNNSLDIELLAVTHYAGNRDAARAAVVKYNAHNDARNAYALERESSGKVGPKNPHFDDLDDRAKVEEYQIAAGVKRTELNLGITIEAAEKIYADAIAANPDVKPTPFDERKLT